MSSPKTVRSTRHEDWIVLIGGRPPFGWAGSLAAVPPLFVPASVGSSAPDLRTPTQSSTDRSDGLDARWKPEPGAGSLRILAIPRPRPNYLGYT